MRCLVICVLSVVFAGCTWVPIDDGAKAVRVFKAGAAVTAGCVLQSEIDVSVKDRLGPVRRDPVKVLDELETLARNEAFEGRANAIQAKAPPIDGRQRFDAFICKKN